MSEIPTFESSTVEFKSEWNEKKDGEGIKKTLVAFANTYGGELYLGVNDDGKPVGLANIDKIEEKLASTVRDNISPSIAGDLTTERLTVAGKQILHVHVDKGPHAPYCLDPKTASGIYIRIGNTSSPASIDDIARMVSEHNPVPYEARVSFEQDLTFRTCMAFCEAHGLSFEPKSNLSFGFWDQKKKAYTNLAYICSDQSSCAAVLIRFADQDKTEILETQRVEGSVFKILEESTRFIAKSNIAWMEKQKTGDATRIDHYFVEPRVILEALVNMTAHRDYSRKPASLVHITPEKIEISTAGGIVEDLSLEDIAILMATECRNKKLAFLLSALHLMENTGSGFRYIRKFYDKKEVPLENLLKVSNNFFTITLPRFTTQANTGNTHFDRVLAYLSTHQSAKREELQNFLGVSQPTASAVLRAMIAERLVERIGVARSARYRIPARI